MKILIGLLSATLSFSAYSLTITNTANADFGNVDIQGIAELRDGIPGTNPGTLVMFERYDQTFYDRGIPHLSVDIRRHDGQSVTYRVWAPNYNNVGWITVYANSCEITFNGVATEAAVFSDQCY